MEFQFPDLPRLLPNFALMILLLTIAPVLTFRAIRRSSVAEVAIFLRSQVLWVVLGSFLFLGEQATAMKLLGTMLVLLGAILVSWKQRKIKIEKGQLFALSAGFLYGISNINGFYILQSLDAFSFEAYATLFPVLLLVISQPKVIKKLK